MAKNILKTVSFRFRNIRHSRYSRSMHPREIHFHQRKDKNFQHITRIIFVRACLFFVIVNTRLDFSFIFAVLTKVLLFFHSFSLWRSPERFYRLFFLLLYRRPILIAALLFQNHRYRPRISKELNRNYYSN